MNNLSFVYHSKIIMMVVLGLLLSACSGSNIIAFDDSVKQTNNLNDVDLDGVIDHREQCDGTTLGALINNDGCSTYEKHIQPYLLDIQFEHDSDKLPDTAFEQIEVLASILVKQPELDVVIEGHSSKVGTTSYNHVLSSKRAKAVAAELINRFNIDGSRISTIGYGFEKLKDLNETEEAHQVNRRIAVAFSYTKEIENMKWTIYSVEEFK